MSRIEPTGTRKRLILSAILVVVLALFLNGCASDESSNESGSVSYDTADVDSFEDEAMAPEELGERMATTQAAPTSMGDGAAGIDADQRLIIRNLSMRLEVEDVSGTVDDIRGLVSAAGGAIIDLQVSTDDWGPVYRYEGTLADGTALSAYMTIRVPVGGADTFATDIRSLGEVLREGEGESDVTQQHIDLSARLRNLEAQEEQLRSFFERADDVEDLLAIQRELGQVRGEIESLQDRVDYLEDQASMATITVELVEPKKVVRPSGTDWGFVDAITTGVRALVSMINGIIIVLFGALPLIVIGLVTFFIVRSAVRRKRRDGQNVEEPPTPPEAQ